MYLEILDIGLFEEFKNNIFGSPLDALNLIQETEIPVDYFKFYNSVSTVYSSKIEGEKIEFDSYFKHKFLNIEYQPDYTKKADDLFRAYEFIYSNPLNIENLFKVHAILSSNLLPEGQQGKIRRNPMYVINNADRIEYVAADSSIIESELTKLFIDIDNLINSSIDEYEAFYYAALSHLVFVKIHPFQDGNGRTGRLLEKWFLLKTLGEKVTAVQLEKNYFKNLELYYKNIRVCGLEYNELNYKKALEFILMTISCIMK